MKLLIPKFTDKKDLFKYLIENKFELIDLKKSAVKHAEAVCFDSNVMTAKAISSTHLEKDDIESGVIHRSIIGNTYNWLDSHGDVHVKGIFTKSINENKAKMRHTHDHIQQLTAKVGRFADVYEKEVAWKDLGINKNGYTTCLLADSKILKSYNDQIFNDYLSGEINQHSVEMIYVKMQLAINDPDEKEEYKAWNSVFPLLGNPEKALSEGYFFIQSESKLKAISCVIEGSNELTMTIEPPNKGTPNIEPDKSTQQIDFAKLANVKIY